MKKYVMKPDAATGLFRVVALREFGFVAVGDVGGLIEYEANLSHEGNCWVR